MDVQKFAAAQGAGVHRHLVGFNPILLFLLVYMQRATRYLVAVARRHGPGEHGWISASSRCIWKLVLLRCQLARGRWTGGCRAAAVEICSLISASPCQPFLLTTGE